jgi:hypothetical protein
MRAIVCAIVGRFSPIRASGTAGKASETLFERPSLCSSYRIMRWQVHV